MRKFLDFSVLLQRERTHKNTGVVSFDPPGERNNGNDWVLVLDCKPRDGPNVSYRHTRAAITLE